MNARSIVQTRAGMLTFGTIAFGTGMVAISLHEFPQMWNVSFPGTLIPITACYLVALCWSEAMWHYFKKARIGERPQNDV